MDRQGAGFNRDGETSWTFGKLDTRITTGSGATAYPAVVDQEKAVGLRLFDTWAEAAHAHHDGVLRLLRMQVQDKLIRQVPEVESVFGKAGRAQTATDPAPLSMIETVINYKSEYLVDQGGHLDAELLDHLLVDAEAEGADVHTGPHAVGAQCQRGEGGALLLEAGEEVVGKKLGQGGVGAGTAAYDFVVFQQGLCQ